MKDAWNSIKDAAALFASLWRGRTTRIKVSALSSEWLREHQIDAGKHDEG